MDVETQTSNASPGVVVEDDGADDGESGRNSGPTAVAVGMQVSLVDFDGDTRCVRCTTRRICSCVRAGVIDARDSAWVGSSATDGQRWSHV